MASLDALRAELDHINDDLLELLNRRARVVLEVAETKRRLGLSMHAPAREEEMLTTLAERNTGPLSQESVREVFTTIIRACRELMGDS